MNLVRRHALRLITLATLATLAAAGAAPALAGGPGFRQDKLFISTNAPAGNAVLVYDRDRDGPATLVTSVPTSGTGTGGGLGSQGAVTLSADGRHLFVVNAGSNSVSTFEVTHRGLRLASVVDSRGLMPTSVAEHDGLVYVLNAGGDGNVAGFRNRNGVLKPIDDGIRGLSQAGGTAPAQVGFGEDGEVLVVTERATQLLTSYRVRHDGSLAGRVLTHSPGVTPFGFAFTRRDVLVVSEAAGGQAGASSASSYVFRERSGAEPILVSAAVPTTQTAACWIAVTPNGRYAYSANAGSSSVSSFRVGRDGGLDLIEAQAGLTDNGGAIDMAVTPEGRQLHVFASRGLQIVSYRIATDGSLSPLGAVGGMPAGSVGLAAN